MIHNLSQFWPEEENQRTNNAIDLFELILKKEKEKPSIYTGSRMELLKSIPSGTKGKLGEELIKELMEQNGIEVKKPGSTDWDWLINNIKVEVKLSSAWGNKSGEFKFQQLRQQPYEILFCIGVDPDEITIRWCTKKDLDTHIFPFDEYRQHAGKDGEQNVFWCGFMPFMRPIEDFINDNT